MSGAEPSPDGRRDQASESADLSDYRDMVVRRWKAAAVILIAVLGAAVWDVAADEATYRATSRLFVGQEAITRSDLDVASELTTASLALVKSYAEAIRSRPIAEEAARRAGVDHSTRHLLEHARSEQIEDTQIIRLAYDDPDRDVARRVANAWAEAFVDRIGSIDPQGVEELGVKVTVLEPAEAPRNPVEQSLRKLVLGALLGLLGAAGAILLLERLDPKIRTPQDAEIAAGRPLLARLPSGDGSPDGEAPSSTPYQVLRAAIASRQTAVPTIVAVTSVEPSSGRTTVAIELARAFADAGRATVIVETDLRAPSIAEHLHLDGSGDLAAFLDGSGERCIRRTDRDYLLAIPAGRTAEHPDALLTTARMRDLMGILAERAEVVVLDVRGADSADAAAVAPFAHCALLVLRPGILRKRDVRERVRSMEAIGFSVLGLVLNERPDPGSAGGARRGDPGLASPPPPP